MNLSPQTILAKLEEWNCYFQVHLPDRSRSFGRPQFYTGGEETLQEHVPYILKEGCEMPDISGNAKMLFISATPKQVSKSAYGYLVSTEDIDPYELLNLIQRIFDFYDQWEDLLNQCLEEEISLQTLLDESVEIFGNPLTISTADFFMVGHSSIMKERENLRELLDPNNLFEYCTAFKQDEEYNKARTYHGAFFYPEYITGYRNLCINLFDHGIYAYRVAIPEVCSSFQPGMTGLLEYMAGYLKKILGHPYMTGEGEARSLQTVLIEALGKTQNPEQLGQRLALYGWAQDHQYVCLVFQTALLDQQNLTVSFICRHIESLLSHACAFPYQEDILVFVNLTRFGGTVEDVYRKLLLFLRDSFLKAGISRTFTGFREMMYDYRQARSALETGSRCRPYQWVHSFEDTALFYMLQNASGEFPVKICSSEKVRLLWEYDKEHQTEFYKTLKVYLENNENAVKSARKLFIHRSTFLYRLERIKEMTGLDLNDPDMHLYCLLSYRILELYYGDKKSTK